MQANCWQVLEITPTDDERAIKRAYAAQLKHNKPDKHPEGFRKLREAYEQALAVRLYYADFIEADEGNDWEDESDAELSGDNDIEDAIDIENTIDVKSTINVDDVKSTINVEKEDAIISNIEVTSNDSAALKDEFDDNINEAINVYGDDHSEEGADTSSYVNNDYPNNDCANGHDLANENNASTQSTHDDNNYDDNVDDFDQPAVSHYELTISQDTNIQKPLNWQQQWQQQVDNAETNNADSQLLILLQTQFQAIQQLPLDEQYDFEESLLVWLSEQPLYYPDSYAASKAYFDWEQRLLSWDDEGYPWYQLRPLDSGYQQVLNFASHTGFRKYLSEHYPLVAQYLYPSDLLPVNAQGEALNPSPKLAMSRWQFFRKFFVPAPALALFNQLEALQEELAMVDQGFTHSYGGADSDMSRLMAKLTQVTLLSNLPSNADSPMQYRNPAHYWQNYAPLLTLRQWVMGRFIRKENLLKLAGIGALFIAVLGGIDKGLLGAHRPWPTYLYEMVGVSLVLVMALAVWQLLLMLYARPYRFLNEDRYHAGNLTWLFGSAAMWLLFTSLWMESTASTQVGIPHELSYYVANLAGFSFLLALNTRHDNLLLIQIIWYWALAMLSFTVIYPLLLLISANGATVALEINTADPVSWLFVIVPMLLVNLARIEPFSWVEPIANWLVGALLILLVPLFFMIVVLFNSDILPKLNLGWTGIALTLLWTAMAYILLKSIRALNQD